MVLNSEYLLANIKQNALFIVIVVMILKGIHIYTLVKIWALRIPIPMEFINKKISSRSSVSSSSWNTQIVMLPTSGQTDYPAPVISTT